MRRIVAPYPKPPFSGWPRLTAHGRRLSLQVHQQRGQRVMPPMGREALNPTPGTSLADPPPTIDSDRLGEGAMTRPYQVGSAARPSVPKAKGFLSLVALLDGYRRDGLAWPLANTLAPAFCVEALAGGLGQGWPAIFNTNPGVQGTRLAVTSRLARAGVAIHRESRGRARANSLVERRWRTVTYEARSLKDERTGPALGAGRERSFHVYNHERPQQGFAYRTPAQVPWKPSGSHGNIHLM